MYPVCIMHINNGSQHDNQNVPMFYSFCHSCCYTDGYRYFWIITFYSLPICLYKADVTDSSRLYRSTQ